MSGSSNALETAETSFHQDLNGDGTIGVPGGGGTSGTTIESFGSTALVQSGGHYFMNPVSGGTGPELNDLTGSAALTVGEYGAWTPLGAEATSTGYEVAWKDGSADQYTVWQTDSSGHFLSSTDSMSGSSNALETAETSFHQDLNGDGTIGVPASGGATVAAQVFPTDEAPIIGLANPQHSDHG
jgi:serralysin